MDGVHHGDLHPRHGLCAALIHGRDFFDAFFLQPQAEFEDTNRDRIELLADLNRIANVIAMPVGAEQRVGLPDVLLALRAHGITGNPGIDIEGPTFRRLDAEGGVTKPRELDSFRIHVTPQG